MSSKINTSSEYYKQSMLLLCRHLRGVYHARIPIPDRETLFNRLVCDLRVSLKTIWHKSTREAVIRRVEALADYFIDHMDRVINHDVRLGMSELEHRLTEQGRPVLLGADRATCDSLWHQAICLNQVLRNAGFYFEPHWISRHRIALRSRMPRTEGDSALSGLVIYCIGPVPTLSRRFRVGSINLGFRYVKDWIGVLKFLYAGRPKHWDSSKISKQIERLNRKSKEERRRDHIIRSCAPLAEWNKVAEYRKLGETFRLFKVSCEDEYSSVLIDELMQEGIAYV